MQFFFLGSIFPERGRFANTEQGGVFRKYLVETLPKILCLVSLAALITVGEKTPAEQRSHPCLRPTPRFLRYVHITPHTLRGTNFKADFVGNREGERKYGNNQRDLSTY